MFLSLLCRSRNRVPLNGVFHRGHPRAKSHRPSSPPPLRDRLSLVIRFCENGTLLLSLSEIGVLAGFFNWDRFPTIRSPGFKTVFYTSSIASSRDPDQLGPFEGLLSPCTGVSSWDTCRTPGLTNMFSPVETFLSVHVLFSYRTMFHSGLSSPRGYRYTEMSRALTLSLGLLWKSPEEGSTWSRDKP